VACLTFCETTELALVTPPAEDGGRKQLGHYYAVPIYGLRERDRQRPYMLFSFSQIENRPAEIVGSWLKQADDLRDVRSLYFAGIYGRGFLETRFLALTQAAEAYHRRSYPGMYMDPETFRAQVLKPLKTAIPHGLDRSHRAAITSRLTYANEYSLRRRMQALFAEHRDALLAITDEPDQYVGPIVDHRNDVTHFPRETAAERRRGGSRDPERLLLYNWILRLLLEACFLKTMGFSAAEIRSFVNGSEVYRQMRARFREEHARSKDPEAPMDSPGTSSEVM
jgi:hypothetical protein